MELPQPRPFEPEGRKPPHDFLSLYLEDGRPPSQGGGTFKTHDFLQPLEQVGKPDPKEGGSNETPPMANPPPVQPQPIDHQHVLPGGIGTYSISHMPYFNHGFPKPEGATILYHAAEASSNNDENSNSSSYNCGFKLWEESKGKTEMENLGDRPVTEAAVKGQWVMPERPLQSLTNNNRNSFSSLSSSILSGQKSQSFLDMIKSGKSKSSTQEDDLDEEEEYLKKESSSTTQRDLRIKVDGKNSGMDQKPNTPRSKHSATEQRRRSKINDRFQMLRQLIPHGDQKRDKASFLLEVIEYIQFLQEKVNKYEGSYSGWNHEPGKLMAWKNNHQTTENYVDQPRSIDNGSAGPSMIYAKRFDEKSIPKAITQTIRTNTQTSLDQSETSSGFANKAISFPTTLQPNLFSPTKIGSPVAQLPIMIASEAENSSSRHRAQSCQRGSYTTDVPVANDKLKEKELTVQEGSISISSAYSQGLLNSLREALESSGVDLSQASISVKIELGKQANKKTSTPAPTTKGNDIVPSNQRTTRSRVGKDFDKAAKKVKMNKS